MRSCRDSKHSDTGIVDKTAFRGGTTSFLARPGARIMFMLWNTTALNGGATSPFATGCSAHLPRPAGIQRSRRTAWPRHRVVVRSISG